MNKNRIEVCKLQLNVFYKPTIVNPEALAAALDRLLATALSTPGILEELGDPRVGEFVVAGGPDC